MSPSRPQKSTTVRTSSRALLAVLRVTFGVLDRLAPDLGARLALNLWCRVPHRPAARVSPRTGPAGQRVEVDVDGRAVVGETWGSGPIVYLLHGWGGWRGQFDAFVAPLVSAGYRVVALDTPSHGDSAPGVLGPRHSLLPEFVRTLAAVTGSVGRPHAIVAHSLGGTAAAVAVLDGLETGRLVLIAAPADPIAHTHEFARTLGFGERTRRRLLSRMEALCDQPVTTFDVPTRARAPRGGAAGLPPVLVVHDRLDKEVPYEDSLALSGSWPDAELATTEGLGHRRILRAAPVVDLTLGFLGASPAAATGDETGVRAARPA